MRISDWSSDVCSSDLGFCDTRRLAGVSRRARRVHRGRDPAAGTGGRQYPLLRPPPRTCAHRLGQSRSAARGMGAVAQTGGAAGRCRGSLAFLGTEEIWRQGRQQPVDGGDRSEEHTSELQSLMRISYAVFCLKKKTKEQRVIVEEQRKVMK